MSIEITGGRYYTKPWTEEAVQEYLSIGGWFLKGRHDFADLQAARAAGAE